MRSSLRGKRLLIIDDDAAVVDFLTESLQAKGYEVTGMTSPAEALTRIKQEDFDLVISDVEMPEIRGTELLAAILAEKPNQLVVLMTAFGSIDLAVSTVQSGACDFVTKPFQIESLEFAIERAFRDRQMRREIVRLRSSIPIESSEQLVARSPAMRVTIDRARRAAKSKATVLLTGETGTGKSAIARYIHDKGPRAARPFVHVNCAAIPPTLLESELFGVRRGAYTDAREDRVGSFVAAGEGTLFLDEIGELQLDLQAKLLHVLESETIKPLGSNSELPMRARVIAATNQALEDRLREGKFRPDLYYRLNVIRIEVPALRDRREDIVPLVDVLLNRARDNQLGSIIAVSAAAMKRLADYHWPGNVRELANLLERAVALSDHDTILPEDLDFPGEKESVEELIARSAEADLTLDELERIYIRRVVEAKGGNKALAARTLGINRRTLYRKLGE